MSDEKEKDVESRKVSQQTFSIALIVVGLALGWVQWGMRVQSDRIAEQDRLISVVEAKAESAEKAATSYNLALSIQLANVQSDVKWIRERLSELTQKPRP